jgi:hypothetical protein
MILHVDKLRDEMVDREAIKDCIYLYSRGLDRCDGEIFGSVFWPDAIIEADRYTGPPDEFLKMAIPTIGAAFEQCWHQIGNIVIRLKGDRAVAESYFYGYQCFVGQGPRRDVIVSGRYLDKFQRRNGEWRIAHRVVLADWFRRYEDGPDWAAGPFGAPVLKGGRSPEDRSYAFFKGL